MGIKETKRDLRNADGNIKKRLSSINASLKKAGIRIPGPGTCLSEAGNTRIEEEKGVYLR